MTADQPSDPMEGPIPGSSRPSFSAFPDRHSALPAELGAEPRRDPPRANATQSGGEEELPFQSGEGAASIAPEGGATEAGPDGPRRRRRGSRGGRRRRRGRETPEGSAAGAEAAPELESEPLPDASGELEPESAPEAPTPGGGG